MFRGCILVLNVLQSKKQENEKPNTVRVCAKVLGRQTFVSLIMVYLFIDESLYDTINTSRKCFFIFEWPYCTCPLVYYTIETY